MKETDPNRDRWNERYAGRDLVWSSGPNETISREVRDLVPGTALDLGCGEGRNAVWLAREGWKVTAMDFADEAIKKGRQIARAGEVEVNWVVDDVTTWVPDGQFDLVIIAFLHTSPEARRHWMQSAIDATAPSGILLYVGHDPANIDRGVGGPQNPDVLPDLSEIRTWLDQFIIDKAEIIEREVAADPGHGSDDTTGPALDLLVRARKKS